MTTFRQQLVLHKLPLPVDVLRIIKEYAFIDITVKTKAKKDTVMRLIANTDYSGRTFLENIPIHTALNETGLGKFIFYLEDDDWCRQFESIFCTDCGNYSNLVNHKTDRVSCRCYVPFKLLLKRYELGW